jgi:hypothetical protein
MKNFKQLTEELVSLKEYKRGFKSQAAARDVVRSRTHIRPNYTSGETTVVSKDHLGRDVVSKERPDMPGSGEPDTELLRNNREVQRGIGKKTSAAAKKKAAEVGAVRGAARNADIKKKTMTIVKNEKAAKTFGIPDIHAIVDGQDGDRDVAGVTVVGHEKNGYIAKHQGSIHFRHPDGKTHANVELRPSPNGIAIWSSRSGTKRSVAPIAHIEPKGDAISVRGGVSKGNVVVHPEDDLNK